MSKNGRRRGAQPGNLSAAKHVWRAFWRRRALKAEDRWIIPILEDYGTELMDDKGGASEVTAGERRMVEIAQTARGASMLILAHSARLGFVREVDGSWDLAPGVKELAKFLNSERRALETVGLERRARTINPVEAIKAKIETARQGGSS